MTETITCKTKGGFDWTPNFVTVLDPDACIGCGRCFKVCGRSVLNLNRTDDNDEEEDDAKIFMEIVNDLDCIGCEACGKVCPKSCFTFTF